MATHELVVLFKKVYDADVSILLIFEVTETVIEQIVEWQFRRFSVFILLFI